MAQASPIFDQHYQSYLARLAGLDLNRIGPRAGAGPGPEEGAITLTYFNTTYTVSDRGIEGPDGEKPGYDTCTILCRYLIMAGERADSSASGAVRKGGWTGFRDLKDAGPLTVYFQSNVETIISRALSGRADAAEPLLALLGGRAPDLDARYDLVFECDGLPNIPMLVLFNDAEEGFPAVCSVLFRSDVETYLDAECIAMMGGCLAGMIRGCPDPGFREDACGIHNPLDPEPGMG